MELMAYPTVDILKLRQKITDNTDDDALTAVLSGAVAWVETYTGRNFSGTQKTVTDEEIDVDSVTFNADRATVVFLEQMDITEITSVKIDDDNVLDSEDYKFNKRTGRLVLGSFLYDNLSRTFNDFGTLKVTYKFGALTTPADVSEAILSIASSNWQEIVERASGSLNGTSGGSSTAGAVTTERIGDYQISYGNSTGKNSGSNSGSASTDSILNGATFNSVARILSAYKKRRV